MAKAPPSQQLLEIEEIREGIVILKNGELRAVLASSGINFALKSEEEQEALLYAFQDFLNSLDFPVQLVIQSRDVVIKDYLATLEDFEKTQDNELLKLQTSEYRDFIKNFVENVNVMTKNFYVVISFTSQAAKMPGPLEQVKNIIKPPKVSKLTGEDFMHYKEQLLERVEYVRSGLIRMEVNTYKLETEALIELFWSLYNPEEGELVLPENLITAS